MASRGNFFLLTLYLLSISSNLFPSVDGQSYFFKNSDITQYEIRNGKYRIVTTTTTTPPPSIMETFFPWTGTAYNSVRTPEEDEALINSLSDPPPPESNSGIMSWLPSMPSMSMPSMPSISAPSSPMSYPYPVPPPSPQEMPTSPDPTIQFHKEMMDSINIPTTSLPNFCQPLFEFPGSKQSSSVIDMISSYFSFGKRSDAELGEPGEVRNLHGGGLNRFVMQSRSNDEDTVEIAADEGEDDYSDHGDSVKDGMDDDETKEDEDGGETGEGEEETKASNPAEDKPYACPKGGIWRWNGEVCIAVGPVPTWACKPNDLVVSGKIAICRNKIFFSPKVINNIQATKLSGRL